MKERYCPKAECYYHGYDGTCPEHGIKTKLCKEPTMRESKFEKQKDVVLTDKSIKEAMGGGVDTETIIHLVNKGPIYFEDGMILSAGLVTKPTTKLGQIDFIERKNKPKKIVKSSREGYDKDDKLGYFRHFNHSEQLGYECFGEHVNGYYIVTKEYPIRTTIWYSGFENSIKENDTFWYGGFDAHEEGTGDKEDYYG